ncbi:MAG: protoporphyrinogen oxidase [Candidatus Igneacidithiobacillus chanchocoensis]
METVPYLIVGAGITGLSLAYALQAAGKEFRLLEAGPGVGGNIQTETEAGFTYDLGPNTLLVRDPRVTALLEDLALPEQLANPLARRRFVVNRRHELVALGPKTLLGGRLLSARARLRLLTEPFRPRATGDESIAAFVRRRLGPEVLDWMVDPFVSGVYAGDPERLSLAASLPRLAQMEKEHGSLLGAALRGRRRKGSKSRLLSFAGGMQSLPQGIAVRLGEKLLCDSPVTAMHPTGTTWQVESANGDWETEHLILCLPTQEIARLLPPQAATLRDQLAAIEYPELATVALGFGREQIQHPLDGFGVLIPRKLRIATLGALFSSTLFPDRAPTDHVLLTAFLGGAQGKLPSAKTEDIVARVVEDLRPLLGIGGEPRFQRVRLWPRAIPQYQLGHLARVEAIDTALQSWPGLSLLGNWRGGVALGDCIGNGLDFGRSL